MNLHNLDQTIMVCWNIVDDLKLLADHGDPELLKALAAIYDIKFQKLFDEYEDCIKYGAKKSND